MLGLKAMSFSFPEIFPTLSYFQNFDTYFVLNFPEEVEMLMKFFITLESKIPGGSFVTYVPVWITPKTQHFINRNFYP